MGDGSSVSAPASRCDGGDVLFRVEIRPSREEADRAKCFVRLLCDFRLSLDGGEPVLQSVAGAVDGDHFAVVEESVEDRGGEDLVA